MSDIINKLIEWKCDTEGALERFLDDEDLYVECLKEFTKDEAFGKLAEAISQKNAEAAFEYSHTLKGVAANLGLTPLYDAICEVVEPLRAKQIDGIDEKYDTFIKQYEKYVSIVGE